MGAESAGWDRCLLAWLGTIQGPLSTMCVRLVPAPRCRAFTPNHISGIEYSSGRLCEHGSFTLV
jgi:hypothetical protein